MLGQSPIPLVWSEEGPSGDTYAFGQGHRYAVLASVSQNYSLSDVVSYLTNHGFDVTYAWEQGTPTRNLYDIDDWLSSLSPDETSNHRWLYAEANRTGPDTTYGINAPWPLTIYSIAHVLVAVPAPAGQPNAAPVLPPPNANVAAPSGPGVGAVVALAVLAGAVGAVGYLLLRRVWVPPLAQLSYY